jgi:hypothetical protein
VSGGFEWFPDWRGQAAVVVAGGPSAKDTPIEKGRGVARFITVNEGHRICPWADVLYAADSPWWQKNKGCREFKGLRVGSGDEPGKMYGGIREIRLVNQTQIIRNPKGCIASGRVSANLGSNSGFHAIGMAFQFGANPIILVGFDMRVDLGLHWHGAHVSGLNNPTGEHMKVWRSVLDGNAAYFDAVGVRVINCSPDSALKNYPKMTLEQALGSDRSPQGRTREISAGL